jgi:hypothetical protein
MSKFSTLFARRACTCATLMLAACVGLPRLGEDATALRERIGAPALTMPAPRGERWFYPSGPSGLTTMAIEMDGNRVASIFPNVLTDDTIQQISAGQTAEAVLWRIGPPHARVRFDHLKQTAWDYRYRDTWGYVVKLAVMMDDQNRVASKVTERIEATRLD